MPIKRIAAQVGVSPASVHAWTLDIPLSEEHRRRNLSGPRGPQSPELVARRAATWTRVNRSRRRRYQHEGRTRAQARDPLHMAGCMLYWAEGSKERNCLIFANSDLGMVVFFRGFLRECFGLGPTDLTVRLNVYLGNGLTLRRIEEHWLEALELPRSCLRKPTLNHFPTSSSGRKKEPTALRRLHPPRETKHAASPAHLWSDSGVRGIRGAALAGWTAPETVSCRQAVARAAPSGCGGGSRPGPRRRSGRRRGRPR